MPFYTLKNKITGDVTTEMMSFAKLEEHLAANPQLEQVLNAPLIVSGVGNTPKHSEALNDKLKSFKKFYGKGSTINAR